MNKLDLENVCGYSESKRLDYYVMGLAQVMSLVAKQRTESKHSATKEIRRALHVLIHIAWDNSDELIPEISRAFIPSEIYSERLKQCYAMLLEGLLKKFRDITSELPVGSRIRLMNIIVNSIDNIVQNPTLISRGGNYNFIGMIFSKSEFEGGEM